MSLGILILISCLSAFSVIWIVHYAPIAHYLLGVYWSPRLFICKLLIPFDITITLLLSVGGILGLMQAIGGIQSLVYSTLVAVGYSGGVWLMHKFFIPRWKVAYEREVERLRILADEEAKEKVVFMARFKNKKKAA